jgi:hypothetical protein
MKRKRVTPVKGTPSKEITANMQVVSELLSRVGLARQLGYQYGNKRKLYKALGYPENESELTFEYFFNKYDRQDIARAVIDRPCDGTWRGDITILEPDGKVKDSALNNAWKQLNKDLGVKKRLNKVDKLCELGRYSLLLLGLNDVKKEEDFKKPTTSGKKKLLYIKQIAESEADVHTWETDTNNPRYGMPLIYKLHTSTVQTSTSGTNTSQEGKDILVHFSRLMHYVTGNLTSEVYGTSKLRPILNRLIDLEKILGGDAEMFWRGARPGYTASAKEDYELGDKEEDALLEELDKYEHDLRRFIVTKGIDINALESQISDPLNHIDAQLQAISSQTGIPKRVLIGTEESKLAGGQDKDQWLSLIKTRQEEHAETTILRPLIDKLMEYGILPLVKEYNVIWQDVFAPSEAERAKVGKDRADALKAYTESPLASSILPIDQALKHIMGLNEEQVQEVLTSIQDQLDDEGALLKQIQEQQPDPEPAPQPSSGGGNNSGSDNNISEDI